MRHTSATLAFAALAVVFTSGACIFDSPPPVVTIVSPETGLVATDFEPIAVTAEIAVDRGADLESVVLVVDGAIAGELEPELLPPTGSCSGGCTVRLELVSADLTETEHVVSVRALDDRGGRGGDDITVAFADKPELSLSPGDGEDLAGAGHVDVSIAVFDRSPVELELAIDGEPVELGGEPDERCGFGCGFDYPWDTSAIAAGAHTLEVRAIDPFGREAFASAEVDIDDIVFISSIEVTNESDGGDFLEVEVHLFDADTNEHLGCSGQDQGLEQVDASDIRYTVLGRFDDTMVPGLLRLSSIADRDVVVRVIEDDSQRCPAAPGGVDDSIGTSAPLHGADIPTTPPMQFGSVVHLALEAGRPL